MKREQMLDTLEQYAFEAVEKMHARIMDPDAHVPVSPLYIKAIKEAHVIVTSGLKSAGSEMGAGSPEELLVRLEEMKQRVLRQIRRKREADTYVREALESADDKDDVFSRYLDS
jgi:ribosomal protein L16/L10AE